MQRCPKECPVRRICIYTHKIKRQTSTRTLIDNGPSIIRNKASLGLKTATAYHSRHTAHLGAGASIVKHKCTDMRALYMLIDAQSASGFPRPRHLPAASPTARPGPGHPHSPRPLPEPGGRRRAASPTAQAPVRNPDGTAPIFPNAIEKPTKHQERQRQPSLLPRIASGRPPAWR